MRRAKLAVARSRERLSAVNDQPDLASEDAAQIAGDALRVAELEAAQSEPSAATAEEAASAEELDEQICGIVYRESLEQLSIDDLRELAFNLQIPDRSSITEKSALIDEICRRL